MAGDECASLSGVAPISARIGLPRERESRRGRAGRRRGRPSAIACPAARAASWSRARPCVARRWRSPPAASTVATRRRRASSALRTGPTVATESGRGARRRNVDRLWAPTPGANRGPSGSRATRSRDRWSPRCTSRDAIQRAIRGLWSTVKAGAGRHRSRSTRIHHKGHDGHKGE